VADVEALDAQLSSWSGQVQRLGQRARARLLRALLGQQARQLQRRSAAPSPARCGAAARRWVAVMARSSCPTAPAAARATGSLVIAGAGTDR
jgi:hypothetical protein